jgi:hypothetical protein
VQHFIHAADLVMSAQWLNAGDQTRTAVLYDEQGKAYHRIRGIWYVYANVDWP